MKGYEAETYGDRIADVYDGLYSGLDTDGAVETLAELAGSGPVLEVGIGTGRLALPLAERGFAFNTLFGLLTQEDQLRCFADGYAFPAELELMARLAGLELSDRWGGWRRQPFAADSARHVSVYGR